MNNLTLSSSEPNSNWQTLGECRISPNKTMEADVQAWLKEVVCSLCLYADFLTRILISAQDSVRHAFQAGTEMKFEHIHLRVLVSKDQISDEKNWGFFRIEKVGTLTANTQKYDHSIEFYLYPER